MLESITQIEDALSRLDHTRKCITEYLVKRLSCQCGLAELNTSLDKYSKSQWRERNNMDELENNKDEEVIIKVRGVK